MRAEPFAAQASIRNVKLVDGDWAREFLDEAEMFPVGRLKDQVDAAGGAFNKLAAGTGAFGSADEMSCPSTSDAEFAGTGLEFADAGSAFFN